MSRRRVARRILQIVGIATCGIAVVSLITLGGDVLVAAVFVLLYGWLSFKIAAILVTRAKRFGLRDILASLTVAAIFIFLLTRLGPVTAIFFGAITLVAVFFAAIRTMFFY